MLGFSLMLGGILLLANAISCKGPTNNKTELTFDVEDLKFYGKNILEKESISVSGSEKTKTLNVKVKNCQNFTMKWELVDSTGAATSGEAKASGGEATGDVQLQKGKSTLKIKLVGDGMKDWMQDVKITVNLPNADMGAKLKRDEDKKAIFIVNGSEYQTKKDTAKLIIESKEDIKAVKVGGKDIDLGSNKKTAEADVSIGEVSVVVEYDNFGDREFKFTLKKFEGEGELPLGLSKGLILSGNVIREDGSGEPTPNELVFEKGKARVELENIQYSIVTLKMYFDANITTAKIKKCHDSRTAEHADDIRALTNFNVFSGRLAKIDEGRGKGIKDNITVKDNIYSEVLIVGAGEVSYDFEITAEGRKPFTCTIEIKNENKTMLPSAPEGGEGDQKNFYVNRYLFQGLLSNGDFPFTWVGHSKQPLSYPKGQEQKFIEVRQNPEYMGDIVDYLFAFNAQTVEGKALLFFYSLSDNREKEECHDFIGVFGGTSLSGELLLVLPKFNPEEKFVDAFVAAKNTLPLGMMPWALKNKWKKIVKKGFLISLAKEKKDGAPAGEVSPGFKFQEIYDYRKQSKAAEGGAEFTIAQKLKHEHFGNGKTADASSDILSGSKTDEDRDIFYLMPTFSDMDSIESLKYEIKQIEGEKETTGLTGKTTHTYNVLPKGSEGFIIGGDDDTRWVYDEKIKKNVLLGGYDKVFTFLKGKEKNENVYTVDVEVTLKGGDKEVFKYKIDYRNEVTLKNMSYDEGSLMDGDSTCFGVPTSYAPISKKVVRELFRDADAGRMIRPYLNVDFF